MSTMSVRSVVTIIFVMCCVQRFTRASMVEKLCNELLPDNYEIYKAPENDGNPIDVLVGFQVLDIDEIDEAKMDFRLHAFVMNVWNDSRLHLEKYKVKGNTMSILYEKCREYLWTPDIFFETAKQIEDFEDTSPKTLLKVLPDGALIMSTRYSFKAGCRMNFEDYPFDTQRCNFLVSLMTSSDSVVHLKWIGDTSYGDKIQSIKMMREAQPLQFLLQEPTAHSITEVFAEGNYTSLIANFKMVRRLTGSIVNTFAPSTMIVMMSWVSFWLQLDSVPARVALSVTSLLTLCTQVDQYKSQLPPVNYIKAMDIWLFVCILMVFSTLVVFAISYNMHTRKCDACKTKRQAGESIDTTSNCYPKRKVKTNPFFENEGEHVKFIQDRHNLVQNFKSKECQGCLSKQSMGNRVDEACRKLFPGTFLIFAIAYWVHYTRIYNANCFRIGNDNRK